MGMIRGIIWGRKIQFVNFISNKDKNILSSNEGFAYEL